MVKRINKIIIVSCVLMLFAVAVATQGMVQELSEDNIQIEEIITDIEYDEVYCEFLVLEDSSVTVMLDGKETAFEVSSPYKFIGIKPGEKILLLVPNDRAKKVALKIEDTSILN